MIPGLCFFINFFVMILSPQNTAKRCSLFVELIERINYHFFFFIQYVNGNYSIRLNGLENLFNTV